MEITNRKLYKEIVLQEKRNYYKDSGGNNFLLKILKSHPDYYSWKYVKSMRRCSYYYFIRKKNIIHALAYIVSCRKFNSLGRKIGIECGENVFEPGLKIYHTNGIVINGNSRVGKNCRLYGNNCIGNDGKSNNCPVIGDNARICAGAKVLGNVKLGNNVVVAAGAVVVNSFEQDNIILGGIPAKVISKNENVNFLE